VSVYPFHGFRFVDPKTALIPGLTFVGWWSCHHMYGARVSTDSGSGEARAASMAAVQSASVPPISQAVDANRPRYYDSTLRGATILHREAGRASYLTTTNATVAAVASGNDPSFTACGVFGGTGNYACPLYWSGAGGCWDVPIVVSGSSIRCWRRDGAIASNVSIGAATLVASTVTWCIFRNGLTQDTFINGSFVSTITLTDTASATMGDLNIGCPYDTNPEQVVAEWAIWSGIPSGADAATRYRAMQRVVRSMGSRFGIPG
jgi:hypothetical protein